MLRKGDLARGRSDFHDSDARRRCRWGMAQARCTYPCRRCRWSADQQYSRLRGAAGRRGNHFLQRCQRPPACLGGCRGFRRSCGPCSGTCRRRESRRATTFSCQASRWSGLYPATFTGRCLRSSMHNIRRRRGVIRKTSVVGNKAAFPIRSLRFRPTASGTRLTIHARQPRSIFPIPYGCASASSMTSVTTGLPKMM